MNIQLGTKEHEELMRQFESLKPGRIDRESKEFWSKGRVYQNGEVNNLFLMFRCGVAYGLMISRL